MMDAKLLAELFGAAADKAWEMSKPDEAVSVMRAISETFAAMAEEEKAELASIEARARELWAAHAEEVRPHLEAGWTGHAGDMSWEGQPQTTRDRFVRRARDEQS